MSDVSSVHPDSSHSVSTDTEESFLIRQINRSRSFNNSNSNSDSSNSNSNLNSNPRKPNTRSFFRESFTDEHGANKSFNIYQDVINEHEASDDTRDVDLSGLSSLHLNLNSSEPNNTNVLGDLDGNQAHSRSGSLKHISLSRSNSFQAHKGNKRSASIDRSSSRASKRNSLGSLNMLIPQSHKSSKSSNNSPSESTFSKSSQLKNFKSNHQPNFESRYNLHSPEFPPPRFEVHNDSNSSVAEEDREHNRESAYRERIISAYASDFDEYVLKLQQQQQQQQQQYQHQSQHQQPQPQQTIHPLPHDQFKEPILPHIKGPSKKPSQSTFASSKSSTSTRKSILDYESSRKKNPGLHPLMLKNNSSQSLNGDVKIQNVHTVARRGLGFSIVGIVPSIHSAKSPTVQGFNMEKESQQQPKVLKHSNPYNSIKNTMEMNEKEKLDKSYLRESFDGSDTDVSSFYTDDLLLKKIHEYRSDRLDMNTAYRRADTMGWIIFLISFIIPPLFFFLGFGLLDQFIGRTSIAIKRISLVVGLLVLLASLACIGIGFGVGLASL